MSGNSLRLFSVFMVIVVIVVLLNGWHKPSKKDFDKLYACVDEMRDISIDAYNRDRTSFEEMDDLLEWIAIRADDTASKLERILITMNRE